MPTYHDEVLADSPKIWLPIDQPEGTTTFTDALGKNDFRAHGGVDFSVGTLVGDEGAAFFDGATGTGIKQDDAFLEIGDPDDATIECVFRADRLEGHQILIQVGGQGKQLMLRLDGDRLIAVHSSPGGTRARGYHPVETGKTYHAAARYKRHVSGQVNGELSLVVGGVLVDSGRAYGSYIACNNVDLGIGCADTESWRPGGTSVSDGGDPFKGVIDAFAAYDYELSVSRLAAHSAARIPEGTASWTDGPEEFGAEGYVVPEGTASWEDSPEAFQAEGFSIAEGEASWEDAPERFSASGYIIPEGEASLENSPQQFAGQGSSLVGTDKVLIRSMETGAVVAPTPQSFSVSERTGAPDKARFDVNVAPGEVAPLDVGDPVKIWSDEREARTLFGGTINSITEAEFDGYEGRRISYDLIGYTQIAERYLVAGRYTDMRAGAIARDIHARKLEREGVGLGRVEDGPVVESIVFNYMHVSEAFQLLSDETGMLWDIDADKNLQFYERPVNYLPKEQYAFVGPSMAVKVGEEDKFALTKEQSPYRELSYEQARGEYRNRQYVKAGKDLTPPRTEAFRGDGRRRTFSVALPIGEVPTVILNGEQQEVRIGELEEGEGHWYWNKESNQVFQDESLERLETDDELEITYRGIVPILVEKTDRQAVAARREKEGGIGVYEHIASDTSITSQQEADQLARGLLRRYAQIGSSLSFDTGRRDFRKGEVLKIDLPHLRLEDDFLVDSVSWYLRGGRNTDYRLRCKIKAAGNEAVGNWEDWFRKLQRGKGLRINEDDRLLQIRTFFDEVGIRDSFSVRKVTEAVVRFRDEVGVSDSFSITVATQGAKFGDFKFGENEQFE